MEEIIKGVNGTFNVTTDMTEGSPELRVMLQRNNAQNTVLPPISLQSHLNQP